MIQIKRVLLTGMLILIGVLGNDLLYPKKNLYYGFNILENYRIQSPGKKGGFETGEIRHYYEYGNNRYFKQTLDKMFYLEANSIGLVAHGWMTDLHDSEIVFDSADRVKLGQAIRLAHRRGLKVFLRPTIHLRKNSDRVWRGQLQPQNAKGEADWDAWFRSYFDFLSHYYHIATENQADGFFVGVELASTMDQLGEWNRLLAKLKQSRSYQGKLIYQSNGFFTARILPDQDRPGEIWRLCAKMDEGDPEALLFLNHLDYLGLSLYENYGSPQDPANAPEAQKVMDQYAGILHSKINQLNFRLREKKCRKKIGVMVTEFGIKSEAGALMSPWKFAEPGAAVDEQAQVIGYQAFFNAFSQYPWFKGVLFWNLAVDPYYGIQNFPGRRDTRNGSTDFTVNGKPAERLIEQYFAHWSGHRFSIRSVHTALYGVYVFSVLMVILFGLHRILLTFWARRKPAVSPALLLPQNLPKITVQIPLYNEAEVAERILKAAAGLDYPPSLLEIQILDDSTDETSRFVEAFIPSLSPELTVRHIRRSSREGFKAGALAHGLGQAMGEFIAIFDADFIPQSDFLKRLLPYLKDPKVGLVQAAWGYINPSHSMLTRVQELYLDGHFQIEHAARAAAGRFFNFNGTAGIFRRACLEDAGGWELDTLTEDLDLSFRAQMRGWKFHFCPELAVPSELPDSMLLYKAQQFRWTKGSVQVFRKIILKLFRSPAPFKAKLEAVFHLGCNIIYPCTLLMALTLYPMLSIRLRYFWYHALLVDFPLFLFGTGALIVFYRSARVKLGKSVDEMISLIPMALMVGIGLSVSNTKAFWEGAFGIASEFVRTPKTGVETGSSKPRMAKQRGALLRHQVSGDVWLAMAEAGMAMYLLVTLNFAIQTGMWLSVPFVALFAAGFLYVSVGSFADLWRKSKKPMQAHHFAG